MKPGEGPTRWFSPEPGKELCVEQGCMEARFGQMGSERRGSNPCTDRWCKGHVPRKTGKEWAKSREVGNTDRIGGSALAAVTGVVPGVHSRGADTLGEAAPRRRSKPPSKRCLSTPKHSGSTSLRGQLVAQVRSAG